MKQFVGEINRLCKTYQDCCIEVERSEEGKKTKRELKQLCQKVRRKLDIAEPEVLLALMDAYEITREEEMLQEVLDVVSGNIGRLEVSAESVKLLAYCYYYVEEEECAVKAWEMLKELEERGEDVVEVEKVLEELTDLAMKAR